MDQSKQLTVIIPTYNEEANIEKCIRSLNGLAKQIFVVDSYCSDKTKEIAESLGAVVFQGNFITFAEKINWALEHLPIKTEWVMRLDADEVLGDGFLEKWGENTLEADAFAIRRKFVFLGKELNYGGWGGLWDIRIWRHKHVRMENRAIDEHMIVTGELKRLDVKVLDDTHKANIHPQDKNITSIVSMWIDKHNKYSDIEALASSSPSSIEGVSDFTAKIKRFLKNSVYYHIPLFIRPFLFFFYRYFLLLGFLDGTRGFIIHVLHSFWYRFLVDVKIYEQKRKQE